MTNQKKHFVLIAGAWHGGWVWREVAPRLQALGHTVTTPTLTGLGERRHLGRDDTDLSTHVEDVVAHVEMEGLADIILVGWSYGGMVATGAAARLQSKLKALVYLDAVMPEHGKAMLDYVPADKRVHLMDCITQRRPLPALPMELFGVRDAVVLDYVRPRLTPHPWATYTEPVQCEGLSPDLPVGYIYCSGYGERTTFTRFYDAAQQRSGVRTTVVEADHLCMLTQPEQTVAALLRVSS